MNYFYFIIFLNLKKIRTNTTPGYNALLFLAVLNTVNVFSILPFFNFFFRNRIAENNYKVVPVIIFAIVFFVDYYFIYNKHEKIYNKYIKETRKQRVNGYILFVFYVIFTVFFFVISKNFI